MSRKWYFQVSRCLLKKGPQRDFPLIPKRECRRLSGFEKNVVNTCFELLDGTEVNHIVYSSRHGQVHRSVELLQSISTGEQASPSAFTLSVHNAIVGMLTILLKTRCPVVAVSAGSKSFEHGLISSVKHIFIKPHQKVLFIYTDPKVPEIYSNIETGQEVVFVGIVEKGSWSMVLESRVDNNSVENFYNWSVAPQSSKIGFGNLRFQR